MQIKHFHTNTQKKGASIGLLSNLKVQIIATQGAPYGWYLWANHISYLEGIWDFLGAEVAKSIRIDGTKVEPYVSMDPNDVIKDKENEIKEAAINF
ncbi:NAD(P)H-dependent oxidoreductase [Metamycoplasma auris]|uniref:NAD(P)H-dependent oxidoreductase n=1 Tax=Metamycoplasma auris TaxID=51363 RepID=UPI00241116CD|nr:NAD(P)H-dependent oxidoreductase [Metamycoplasma auris]